MDTFKNKRDILVLLLAAVVLLELAWATGYISRPGPTTPSAGGETEAVALSEASLALSPSEGTSAVGENFEVQVILETEDAVTTDGVDMQLSFDPTKLEVLDVSSNDFYPQRLLNTVDNETGTVRLAVGITPEGNEIKGGGAVAAITFKVLQAGEAKVSFGDSSVAANGLNILSQTTGGTYLIE